ncbi:antirepressor AbbA [Bacillus kexueae]|uniref:antirepressor AbbA n=1 Tax=Aeribacillus kexueae TaxID=2078952 RepID=UPI001FAF9C19|nr:antirepressor AbbA [Bacillus kexueae]
MTTAVHFLTKEDQQLLVDVLLNQEYALELVESELHDIENGNKHVDFQKYQKLVSLYDKLRIDAILT